MRMRKRRMVTGAGILFLAAALFLCAGKAEAGETEILKKVALTFDEKFVPLFL